MSLLGLMTTTVTLNTMAAGQDSSGGPTRGAPMADPSRSHMPATIQTARSAVEEYYAQRQLRNVYEIFFAQDVAARAGNLLIEDSTGRIFVVLGYPGDESGRGRGPWIVEGQEQKT